MIFSVPAWVSEPPQNTLQHYYGVGTADGTGSAAMEKARLKALGLKVGGTKPELLARLRAVEPEAEPL